MLITGLCGGVSAPLFVEFLQSPAIGLNLAHVLLLVTLALSFMSGCMAVLLSSKRLAGSEQASGVGARIGMSAGIWAAVAAGSVLILIATLASYSATTAALDILRRAQMWLTLAVSMATVLPSVLCGFVGGIVGAGIAPKNPSVQKSDLPSTPLPWLKWLRRCIAAAAVLAYASPLSRVGQPMVVDPPPPAPPIVKSPAPPPCTPPFPTGGSDGV